MTKNSSENVEPFLPPLHLASAGGRGVVRVRHLGRYYAVTSAANRLIGEVVQSRRRPLLGPSPG